MNNMERFEQYRLCEEVPSEEELDLAAAMREESAWEDEWTWMQEKIFDKHHPVDRKFLAEDEHDSHK